MAKASIFESLAEGVRERVSAAVPVVESQTAAVSALSDSDLVATAQDLEALGRHVDALRVRVAGEIDARSDREGSGRANEDRLSVRFDCANAVEVLERATLVSVREARSRIRLDRRTRERTTLTGVQRPAEYPAVAAALHDGAIGVETAHYLTDEFERLERRGGVSHDEKETGEREIIEAAVTGFSDADCSSDEVLPQTFDEFRVMVGAWAEFLTRDGVEPDAELAARFRGIRLGRARDGLVPLSGSLMPEAAAGLQRLFDAHRGSSPRFSTMPEHAAEGDAWGDEMIVDPRTVPQIRHDVFVSMIQTAAASSDAPSLGGAAPTLVVTVSADDLDGGVADIEGVDIPVPASVAHRIACTGAVQKVVFDQAGRIIDLGARERLFSAHQRRAIGVRDGGCIIPGCSIPAAWCEVHHVDEHSHGGPTHTDNGVLLCWSHHHNLDRSEWQIQMRDGVPFVKAPRWVDHRRIFRPVRSRNAERERIRRRRREKTESHREAPVLEV
ncbi:MAG: DUF222 domain-containing protein [Microbacterium gubbeenense]|uniref:HNH endonuclease signature motif containing protein n=1 Tax=Microbacterium gubbeenense TaxID=159896 RepID=UPI003F981B6A